MTESHTSTAPSDSSSEAIPTAGRHSRWSRNEISHPVSPLPLRSGLTLAALTMARPPCQRSSETLPLPAHSLGLIQWRIRALLPHLVFHRPRPRTFPLGGSPHRRPTALSCCPPVHPQPPSHGTDEELMLRRPSAASRVKVAFPGRADVLTRLSSLTLAPGSLGST